MVISNVFNKIEVEVSEFVTKDERFDIKIGDTYLINISEPDWNNISGFIQNSINFIKANNERKSIASIESDGQK